MISINSWQIRLGVMTIAGIIAIGLRMGTPSNNSMASDGGVNAERVATPQGQIKFEVPNSIAAEHRELHEGLRTAITSGGKTGNAAKRVEERLSLHFEKEEEYALPQLGLLVPLAEGRVAPEMKRAIELSDRLKADMPKMLEEHKGIVEALTALKEAAKRENKKQAITFADHLLAHAQNEEQVMYPAAILVGEYLKLKLKP